MANLLERSSLVLTPSAYNNGEALCIKPDDGSGDFDFSRATDATRINSLGLVETIGINLPRINYEAGCGSFLWEPQSTNLYLNSETLSTQTITTAANQYSVSFYGTGTITFSGTHTGSLTGTSLNDRVTATFTATSGTLTSTISGIVTKAQIEQLSYSTSYIPTSGSQKTRNKDLCTNGASVSSINSTEGVLYFEGSTLVNGGSNRYISLSNNTSSNRLQVIFHNNSNRLSIGMANPIGSVASINDFSFVQTNNNKVAVLYSALGLRLFVNGILRGSNTDNASFTPNTLTTLDFALWNQTTAPFEGNIKCLAIWKEALTDAELISLTTI